MTKGLTDSTKFIGPLNQGNNKTVCHEWYTNHVSNKFERMSSFSDAHHRNTSTDQVSAQNDHEWLRYSKKGNIGPHLTNIWTFFGPNCVQYIQILRNLLIF